MIKSYYIFFLSFALFLSACKEEVHSDSFNRKEMLVNLSSAIILPAINNTQQDLAELHDLSLSFSASSDSANLVALRNKYEETCINFQTTKIFNFGPMEDYATRASMNTYPTDTNKIENNVSSGSYTLSSVDNLTAIGLPAMDYLLYYYSIAETVDWFTIDVNAANRKAYLTDLTSKMKAEFEYVVDAWTDYKHDFVLSDGNDAGSSTSLVFNGWVADIELLKNAKIGIPAGFQTSGQTLPHYVEGYYSGISIDLAIESINSLKKVFTGDAGLGFDDYISDVESDDVSQSLSVQIADQFDACKQSVNSISGTLSDAIDNDFSTVEFTYYEVKKLVTFCKTDMSSILGLLITYQDNDGD